MRQTDYACNGEEWHPEKWNCPQNKRYNAASGKRDYAWQTTKQTTKLNKEE